jgi:hypothetical protein
MSRRCGAPPRERDEIDMLIRMAEGIPPDEAERILQQHYENSIQRYVYSEWFPTHDVGNNTAPLTGPNYRLKLDLRDLVATIECEVPRANQHADFAVAITETDLSNTGEHMWGPPELRSTAAFDFFSKELRHYVILYHSHVTANYRGRAAVSLFHSMNMTPCHIAGTPLPPS